MCIRDRYNPCYYGDFLGDYREEVILGSSDGKSIYIFSTNHPTTHRLPHLMTDHTYDMSQACLLYTSFYIRGLQSLSSSSPLILVDGLERDMSVITPEEVESVSILKDAAAVALYGYKGINLSLIHI